MKHSSTRQLFNYWQQQRGARLAPERGDIDPAAIRHALGDVFILAADFVEEQRFRLAGTKLCALFGRELKGESFTSLWREAAAQNVRTMLADVAGENAGLVAGVRGHNAEGQTVDLELLLLPLAHRGHARIRAIGVIAAIEPPYWLGAAPLVQLELGTVRHVGADVVPSQTRLPNTTPAQLRRGFMVYQGGLMQRPNEKTG